MLANAEISHVEDVLWGLGTSENVTGNIWPVKKVVRKHLCLLQFFVGSQSMTISL